jgi:hypothetical protein
LFTRPDNYIFLSKVSSVWKHAVEKLRLLA